MFHEINNSQPLSRKDKNILIGIGVFVGGFLLLDALDNPKKTLKKEFSEPKDTFIYSLYKNKVVVYYGISNDPENRIKEHERNGLIFDSFKIDYNPKTLTQARRTEKYLIKKDKPKYNIQHNN